MDNSETLEITSNPLNIYYRFGCVETDGVIHLNYNQWRNANVNTNPINSHGPFKLCKSAVTNGKTEESLNEPPKEIIGPYENYKNNSFEVYTENGNAWRHSNYYLIKVGWYNKKNNNFFVQIGINCHGNKVLEEMKVYGIFYKLDLNGQAVSLLKPKVSLESPPPRRLTPPNESNPSTTTSTPSTYYQMLKTATSNLISNIWRGNKFKQSNKSLKKSQKKSEKKSIKKKSQKKSGKKTVKKSIKKKAQKKSQKKSGKKSIKKSMKKKAQKKSGKKSGKKSQKKKLII